MKCEGRKDCLGEATPIPSRTMYHWEGEGLDPNADKILCSECAEEYNLMMDSWWADAQPYV